MAVAKTYQKYQIIGEPYKHDGRQYILIDKDGIEKEVRWYTDREYARMYGETVSATAASIQQKEALGFKEGYITIFKGDQEKNLEWFKLSPARYAKWWGWYLVSGEEVPTDLPEGITPIRLEWDKISSNGVSLNSESVLTPYIDSLLYETSNSQPIGSVGERLTLELKIDKAISFDGAWGQTMMHIMHDVDGNEFKWTTSARQLSLGKTYKIVGTVKEYATYRGTIQTVLTRCKAELIESNNL